jgi:gamma-carbonic anhydrase
MPDLENQLDTFLRRRPKLGKDVYIATGARVIGDVTLSDNVSVWYNAVLRGDINRIAVGACSNIQDNVVLHLSDDEPCVLGEFVTVGHSAIVHACTVGNGVLIGMGAMLLDGARVADYCIIGAGTLVPQGMHVPPGSLVMGTPGRVVRALSAAERKHIKDIAEKYVGLAAYCLRRAINLSPAPEPGPGA